MVLTKEQIISRLAPKIIDKLRKEIVWGDVTSAVAAASNTHKDAIVAALKNKNYQVVGTIIGAILQAKLETDATANVTAAFANDTLNVDELSEILE